MFTINLQVKFEFSQAGHISVLNVCSEPTMRVERVRTRDRRGLPGTDATRLLPRLPHQDQEHRTDIRRGRAHLHS